MNNVQITPTGNSLDLTPDKIKTLEQAGVIPSGTPAAQIAIFAQVCAERRLSPFSKEIHLTGYKERESGQMKYSVIVGINGFRKIAAQSGMLAGIDDAIFDLQADGKYFTAAQLHGEPKTATVTVYRIVGGVRCPFTHTAVFKEFSTGKQKWFSMPFQMIAKVAEAFALRKGFSDETSGLSIEEEAGAFSGETIAARPAYKSEAGVKVEPVTIPESIEKIYDETKAALEADTDFDRILGMWSAQNPESEQMQNPLFAMLFYEAAARTAMTADDLDNFYSKAPARWQNSPRLKAILSTCKAKLANGAA